jgi:hypothetical protein
VGVGDVPGEGGTDNVYPMSSDTLET